MWPFLWLLWGSVVDTGCCLKTSLENVFMSDCRVGVGGGETPWGNTTCCQQVTCIDLQHVLPSYVPGGTFTLMHPQRLCHFLLLFRASSSFTNKCNQLITTMVRFKVTLPMETTTTMGYRGRAENKLINKTCSFFYDTCCAKTAARSTASLLSWNVTQPVPLGP